MLYPRASNGLEHLTHVRVNMVLVGARKGTGAWEREGERDRACEREREREREREMETEEKRWSIYIDTQTHKFAK
jgi:hypothetical protein